MIRPLPTWRRLLASWRRHLAAQRMSFTIEFGCTGDVGAGTVIARDLSSATIAPTVVTVQSETCDKSGCTLTAQPVMSWSRSGDDLYLRADSAGPAVGRAHVAHQDR